MTALDHLRKLIECPISNEDHCHFCGMENYGTMEIVNHAPDCSWVAAKEFVDKADELAKDECELVSHAPGGITHYRAQMVDTPMRSIERPSGFTLIELLVVIAIIVMVSAVALPMIIPALSHRQVSEGARLLQAQLAGARDAAIRDNAPSGFRLLPDPQFSGINPATGMLDPTKPLAYNRMIPIRPAPNYSEGNISIYDPSTYPASIRAVTAPSGVVVGVSCLIIEQDTVDSQGAPTTPTNWFWNIRVGDQIQINNAGPWYTIIGPMVQGPLQGNSEMFVNIGVPGTPLPGATGSTLPMLNGGVPAEFLLLVNGKDDNRNGWIDEGFDGVDNNGNGQVDELAEWIEQEAWLGSLGSG